MKEPSLNYLLRPVCSWLLSQGRADLTHTEEQSSPPSEDAVTQFISAFLITLQNMDSNCPQTTTEDEDDDDDGYVLKGYRSLRDVTSLLNLDLMLERLEQVFEQFKFRVHDVQNNLRRVLPFLVSYLDLVREHLTVHAEWARSLFKLDYVLCSVISTLTNQGFCKPPDTEDENNAGGDASETTGGVGLGEGSGTENISKEIEDESQVEGLQGDDADGPDPQDKSGDDDAIEMSEDIGGKMEDVPDTGSDQEDAGSDGESEADPEERMEKLDASDPSAVDEKMWGDEEGPQDPDQPDDKTSQDRSEDQTGDSEVVAKEGKQKQSKEKTGDADKDGDDDGQETEEGQMPEELEDEDAENPAANGAQMDEYVEDANTLDLPPDMDLGLGEDLPEGPEGAEEEEDLMEDIEPEQEDGPIPEDGRQEETDATQDNNPDTINQTQEEDVPGQPKEVNDEDAMAEDEEAEVEEAVAQPDVSAGEGEAAPSEPRNPDGGESASTGQQGNSDQGQQGMESANEEQNKVKDGLVLRSSIASTLEF